MINSRWGVMCREMVKDAPEPSQRPKTDYLIEDIPVKPRIRRIKDDSKYPFGQMKVNQSFLVRQERPYSYLGNLAEAWGLRRGKQFASVSEYDKQGRYIGIRIGRTK